MDPKQVHFPRAQPVEVIRLVVPAVQLLLFGVAGLLLLIGGFSDTNVLKIWGWGFAVMAAGLAMGAVGALLASLAGSAAGRP